MSTHLCKKITSKEHSDVQHVIARVHTIEPYFLKLREMDALKSMTYSHKALNELIEHIALTKFKIEILQHEYDLSGDSELFHHLVQHKMFLAEVRDCFKNGSWMLN